MPIRPVEVSPTERSLMIVPPVMGWSTKQPLAEMDPRYSPEIENFIPIDGGVELRNGSEVYADLSSTIIVSLVNYNYQSTNLLIACGSSTDTLPPHTIKLWNVLPSGASVEITKNGPATTPQYPWYYFQQYKDFLFFSSSESGTEPLYYWQTGSYDETGVGGIGPLTTYKGRLYGGTNVGTIVYYSDFDSPASVIAGFPNSFDITSLCRLGGNISFLGSTTRAKDFSEDELFCVITDQGEVFVYQGDSPEDTTWTVIGHYYLPTPLGERAFFYIGHDLNIITNQGVIPMSGVMAGAKTGSGYATITEEINSVFSSFASPENKAAFMGVNYPAGNYAVINIPQLGIYALTPFLGENIYQIIINTNTGAITKFTGQDAYCWATFGDNLYFGSSSGVVFKANSGYVDEDANGDPVARTIKLRHAFNYFGDPTKEKIFTKVQPIMYQSEGMSITCNMDVDFSNTTATATEGPDTSKGTSYQIYKPEIAVTNDDNYYGTAGSFRIDGTVTTKRFRLEATKVFWSEG